MKIVLVLVVLVEYTFALHVLCSHRLTHTSLQCRYQNSIGQRVCKPCDMGTYSRYGGELCTKCPAGTVASKTGSSQCTPCAAGFYANAPDSATSCRACPRGEFL